MIKRERDREREREREEKRREEEKRRREKEMLHVCVCVCGKCSAVHQVHLDQRDPVEADATFLETSGEMGAENQCFHTPILSAEGARGFLQILPT